MTTDWSVASRMAAHRLERSHQLENDDGGHGGQEWRLVWRKARLWRAWVLELAKLVRSKCEKTPEDFTPLYSWEDKVEDKIAAVATKMYGAASISFTKLGKRKLREVYRLGYGNLPVCIAKTQSSLSDDPKRLGRPRDFDLTVRDIHINAGAGFLVIMTGEILRMPGLPRRPSAEDIDVVDGRIIGLR